MAIGRLERVLYRDRIVISIALALLTALAWVQMVMPGELTPGMERLHPCCGASFAVTFAMWVGMMAGMMIPSALPMVLTHAAIVRRRAPAHGTPFVSSGLFLSGYLLAWSGFSFVAAAAQGLLYRTSLLDGRTLSVGPWLGAAALLAAGLFQLSDAKRACLSQCRAPVGYFMTDWRSGRAGAVAMGLHHGMFCIGCCWLLMVILFAVGVMNIVWGAAITIFVVAEKVLPWPRLVVGAGAALCFLGSAALLWRALTGG